MLQFIIGSRRYFNALSIVIALMMVGAVRGEEKSPQTVGSIERLDPALDKLVPADAKMEVIGEGFAWCEGPVWIRDGNFLLFSDIPNNAIMRWDAKSGSQAVSEAGRLHGQRRRAAANRAPTARARPRGPADPVSARRPSRRAARFVAGRSAAEVRHARRSLRGKRFNSPNDAVVHSSGAIYFTDPPYGLEKEMDDPAKELPFQGVYRIAPDGK